MMWLRGRAMSALTEAVAAVLAGGGRESLAKRLDEAMENADYWALADAAAEWFAANLPAAVESVVAAERAEAVVEGQMRHITAEMVRGDQPLEAKEELIADLRARLSHTEAERDQLAAERAEDRARLAAVEALANDWEMSAGPGTYTERVCGRQVVSVEFAVRAIRAALAPTATHDT